ncbi:unnamed protein product, partial [Mycena citricolor]
EPGDGACFWFLRARNVLYDRRTDFCVAEPGSEDEDGDCESDDARTIHAGDSDSECESEDAASGVLLEDLVVEWMSWIHSFAGRK